MPERDMFSPSEQNAFSGNRRERWMLRRIARATFSLPQDAGGFDEKGRGGLLRVHGTASSTGVRFIVEEDMPGEADGQVKCTDVAVDHDEVDPNAIVDLSAHRFLTDDTGSLRGVSWGHKSFALGA